MLRTLQASDPANNQWHFNLMVHELLDLDIRSRLGMPPEQLIAEGRELAQRVDQFLSTAKNSPKVDNWARLAWMRARALAELKRYDEALALLQEMRDKQTAAREGRTSDLGYVTAYVELRRQTLTLIPASRLPQRTALCEEIRDILVKMAPAIGVHQQITEAWVEAQSCLGQGEREDVQRAAKWLRRDRGADVPS